MFILVLLILGLTAQVLTNSFHINNNNNNSNNNNNKNDLCPKMCICDTDAGLNRANCSSKHLISAQINMPKFVEIFDLQWNDITIIENKCFSDLKHLQEINLDNNAIHTIDLNAFIRLKYLKKLSLANNRLESFDHRILENAKSLLSLNLSGNKFMNLVNVPLLKSKSLQSIDLHNSKINFLHENTFHELPQLIDIDLSQNLLITLNNSPFIRNNKIKTINLDDNPWNCDENMQKTLRWLTSRKVNVTIRGCFITRQMFERMEMQPVDFDKINGGKKNKTTNLPQEENVHVDIIWKELRNKYTFLNQICPLNNSEEACNMYEACAVNLSSAYKDIDKKLIQLYDTKPKRRNIVTMVSIDAALLAGFIFGTIFGGTFVYLVMMCIERCKENKKARHLNDINITTESMPTTPPSLVSEQPLSPPLITTNSSQMTRRNRRRQRRLNEHQLRDQQRQIVRDQRSTTFFGSLFDRPVRRRCMRSINQNATNLVRRLSQSRLALNLTRAANSRNNNSNNNNSPAPRVVTTTNQGPTAPPNNNNTLPHQRNEYQGVPTTVESSVSSNRFLLGHNNGTSRTDSLNNREWITASQPNLHHNITDDDEDNELYEVLIPPSLQRAETPPPAYKDLIK